MKILNKIYALAAVAVIASGCDSFLDKEYDSSTNDDKVFTSERLTRQFLTNIYLSLPDGFTGYTDSQFYGAPRDCMTDNAYSSWGIHRYHIINNGSWTNQNNPFAYFWGDNYAGIRKTNMFLENCDRAGISDAPLTGDNNRLLTRMKAEARILRALFHLQLVSYFGDVVIVDKVLTFDELNQARTPAADVLKWIMDEMDEIKDDIPFNWADNGNWGRVNGATALAVKSRAALYRASPLFRPSDVSEGDLWADAAAAVQEFITRNNSFSGSRYELYQNYDELFYGLPYMNNEVILSRSVWYTFMMEEQCVPPAFPGCHGYAQPTQNFVDCFENIDGTEYDPTSTKATTNPYQDRDPRLDMIVFRNGSTWSPSGTEIEIWEGGNSYDANNTITGYYVRKWCNPDIDYSAEVRTRGRGWIVFRYAEILLNYAEAANESQGPAAAEGALNQVRERAGLPPVSGLMQAQMREKIENERRIELSFEDHRYVDVRRLRLYDDAQKYRNMTEMRGVKLYRSGNSITYDYYTFETRAFEVPKHYLMPIPYDETVKAPLLGQNPGWSTAE